MHSIRVLTVIILAILLSSCRFGSNANTTTIEESRNKSSNLSEACDYASYEARQGFLTGFTCYADQLLVNKEIIWEGKPIRFARVEILTDEDQVLAATNTNAYGYYEVDLSDLPDLSIGMKIRSRVLTAGSLSTSESRVLGESGYPYAIASNSIGYNPEESPVADLIAVSAEVAPAYNILDQFVDAQIYLDKVAGVSEIPKLDAIWYPGNNLGTFYCPASYGGIECEGKDEVYILGSVTDSDAYDDVILLHEYAHFVLDKFSRDDSPGGTHYIEKNDQDLRLSWSEGFSTAFAAMVRYYHSYEGADEFIDTDGNGEVLFNYFLELPLGGLNVFSPKTHALGLANELAVSVVLFDIVDTAHTDEDFDSIEEESLLWQSIFSMKERENTSMQDFVELWEGSPLTPLLDDRKIFMSADEFEAGDENVAADISSIEPVSLPIDQQRTLHLKDDTDWLLVNLSTNQNYQIALGNFLSGADVKLAMYQSDGITPAFSKNAPDFLVDENQAYYAKNIEFMPELSGNYFLHMKRSASSPSFVRYGSYQLKAY